MHKSTIAFRLLEQMTIVVQKMRLTSSAQIAAILMLAAGLLTSCHISSLKNQKEIIEIGKLYQYSHEWGTENPFEKIEIDTVEVVAISGDYVQWEYKKGFRSSGKLKYFKHHQRPLK
jgi:hypothetical protein